MKTKKITKILFLFIALFFIFGNDCHSQTGYFTYMGDEPGEYTIEIGYNINVCHNIDGQSNSWTEVIGITDIVLENNKVSGKKIYTDGGVWTVMLDRKESGEINYGKIKEIFVSTPTSELHYHNDGF